MGRFVRTTLGARVIATKRRLSEPEQLRKTAGIPTSPAQLLFTNGDGEFDPKCLAPQREKTNPSPESFVGLHI